MIRQPAVAGQFYPSDQVALRQTIQALTPTLTNKPLKAYALISPHAGYFYSGAVAAETIAQVTIPNTVIILGPNHNGRGKRLAVMASGTWQMPLGDVPINSKIAQDILDKSSLFQADEAAHLAEHSLEVQIPFLQAKNPHVTLVPICVSHLSFSECQEAGSVLAQVIKNHGKSILLVASTDLTHYEPRESASAKDNLVMDCIGKLDPQRLFKTVTENRISMCGIIPTTITLCAAKALGATRAQLTRYMDSGEMSGDTDQVVGYAGYTIC